MLPLSPGVPDRTSLKSLQAEALRGISATALATWHAADSSVDSSVELEDFPGHQKVEVPNRVTQIGMVKMYDIKLIKMFEVIHNHDHRICDFCLLAATGARRRDDSWHVGERQEPFQSRSVIPKMVSQNRTPIAGWFIWKLLETPFKMDDIGGTPMTLETSKDGLKAKHTFENHKASFSLSCSTS